MKGIKDKQYSRHKDIRIIDKISLKYKAQFMKYQSKHCKVNQFVQCSFLQQGIPSNLLLNFKRVWGLTTDRFK